MKDKDYSWIDGLKKNISLKEDELSQFYSFVGYLIERTQSIENVGIYHAVSSFVVYSLRMDFDTQNYFLENKPYSCVVSTVDHFKSEFDKSLLLLNSKDTADQARNLLLGQQPIKRISLFLNSFGNIGYHTKAVGVRYCMIFNELLVRDIEKDINFL